MHSRTIFVLLFYLYFFYDFHNNYIMFLCRSSIDERSRGQPNPGTIDQNTDRVSDRTRQSHHHHHHRHHQHHQHSHHQQQQQLRERQRDGRPESDRRRLERHEGPRSSDSWQRLNSVGDSSTGSPCHFYRCLSKADMQCNSS